MARDRKPTQSWIKRAKIEIEHEEELTIERAYELGRIRGKKETIDKQKAIDDVKYKKLIDMLIGELYTSRAYHLGLTGLDSPEEIKKKEREGDCALIRGIDRTILYVKEAMMEE